MAVKAGVRHSSTSTNGVKHSTSAPAPALRILLTNGRFPVTLDLARQLKLAGHHVYVVDPMHYHVCKFSCAVRKSYYVPAPFIDPAGYVQGVKKAVAESKIDLIIPMHEEVLHLADCDEPEIRNRLFAPPFPVLLRLHNKWEFVRWLKRIGLDGPTSFLCRNMEDVKALDQTKEYALKPVFGRASSKVYHLKPGKPLPQDCDLGEDNHYVAQEWSYGARFCTYSVVRGGRMRAFGIYPVKDTVDGSSCVYFEAVEHVGIQEYVETLVSHLGDINGQFALDIIQTEDRLLAIECNPRATSGIHLFSRTPALGAVFTQQAGSDPLVTARPGSRRQVAPGMLMVPVTAETTLKEYLHHMGRLVSTRDVMFAARDIGPSLMQPFLLTSYYKICRELGGMKLKDMFQRDMLWEPKGQDLDRIRHRLDEIDAQLDEKDPV